MWDGKKHFYIKKMRREKKRKRKKREKEIFILIEVRHLLLYNNTITP